MKTADAIRQICIEVESEMSRQHFTGEVSTAEVVKILERIADKIDEQAETDTLRSAAQKTLDAIDNVLNGADEHGRGKLAAAATMLEIELKKSK